MISRMKYDLFYKTLPRVKHLNPLLDGCMSNSSYLNTINTFVAGSSGLVMFPIIGVKTLNLVYHLLQLRLSKGCQDNRDIEMTYLKVSVLISVVHEC